MQKVARLAIIGGGPAGYVSAIRASQLNTKVLLIEKEQLGGTCVNKGCIPTKALLQSAAVFDLVGRAGEFGIVTSLPSVNFIRIMERKKRIVQEFRERVSKLLQANKVEYISGEASFQSPKKIKIIMSDGEKIVAADKVIIATGSEPTQLRGLEFAPPLVLTSQQALDIEEIPQSILIVGGGVIGAEFTCLFNTLGSEVTLVEMMAQILPDEDSRLSQQLTRHFKQKGVRIHTDSKVSGIEQCGNKAMVSLNDGSKITVEKGLVCVGRKPVTSGLGLERVGIELAPDGSIIVNDRMETRCNGIWAAGDVTGKVMLAHVAFEQGMVAAENACQGDSRIDYSVIPHFIYTHPEIASVGLTVKQATSAGYRTRVSRTPFGANSKASILGEDTGFVQIIIDEETKQFLGAQIMGPCASELIQEICVAMKNKLSAMELGETIHAHPTLVEAIQEATRFTYSKSIHTLPLTF